MNSPPIPRAVYLRVGSEVVFGVYHEGLGVRAKIPVLICPPFGWAEVCSYRARREWAEDLAARGHPVLRIDLPGTGDSAGTPEEPQRLDAWSHAAGGAAAWLGERASTSTSTSTPTIAAIGIGLGGQVVCLAAAAGAPIEQAVLWATPSRGKALVRELRALARMEGAQVAVAPSDEVELSPMAANTPEAEPSPADDTVEAGGFALSEETAAALSALDLAELSFAAARPRRALLLGADGIEADERLCIHLRTNNVDVTLGAGEGYGAMMAEPQEARPPADTIAHVAAWLAESPVEGSPADGSPTGVELADGSPATRSPTGVEPAAGFTAIEAHELELTIDGARVRERAFAVEQPFGRLFGILAEPLDAPPAGLAAVLLNAGAIRRIGPNRMWVEVARRWAARGVPTLRLDVEGIGDADGDATRYSDVAELYIPELVGQARAALDALERDGIAERFVLMGLCSGAYWSFHAALQDARVTAALMLNPQVLFWDVSQVSQETLRELRKAFLRRSSWARALRGGSSLGRARELLRELPTGISVLARRRLAGQRLAAPSDDALQDALRQLDASGQRALFVFSGEEPLYEELDGDGGIERLERWPRVELVRIPGHDHTLRPPAARRGAYEALDRALERELRHAASTSPSTDGEAARAERP
jgi:alpha-beta hydrolase superfamily lysophospholipase